MNSRFARSINAEPDPADVPVLSGVCDELAGRGRSTAAVVTAAVVAPDPLPGTELIVDDHGQLHGEELTGSTATTAPDGQLVAAHASAAAAATNVARTARRDVRCRRAAA